MADNVFIRVRTLASRLDVNPVTIGRWVKSGVLPPPVQITPGVVGWRSEVIDQWLQQRLPADEKPQEGE